MHSNRLITLNMLCVLLWVVSTESRIVHGDRSKILGQKSAPSHSFGWLLKKFIFSNPKSWPQWAKCFKQFHLSSELSKKSEEYQINMLVYTMGMQQKIFFILLVSPTNSQNFRHSVGKVSWWILCKEAKCHFQEG